MKPLKRVVSSPVNKGDAKPRPFVALEDIVSGCGRLAKGFEWTAQPSTDCVLFRSGDVLFGKLRPYLRKYLLADRDGCCQGELLVLRPKDSTLSSRFLFYLVQSSAFIAYSDATSYGVKMPRTSWEILGPSYAAMPDPPEQDVICSLLDRETARIDALVEKKQRLIALLEEKRAALINRAVTKGLDPNVPMKDSGIPWLGQIPAHWKANRLKFSTSRVTSGSRGWAEHYTDDGALFLRVGNLTRSKIDLDLMDVQHVTPPPGAEGIRTATRQGDVLVSITAYIGSVAVIPAGLGEAYVSQHLALTSPIQSRLASRWLAYCLLSDVGQSQFRLLLYGGTKDGLGLDDVGNLWVQLPPKQEQTAIVEHLDRANARISLAEARVQEQVASLQEYRTALISAAVTGRIDVRGAIAE
jgi:type I restriction enzyme S subunit